MINTNFAILVGGDIKKSRDRLRNTTKQRTHYTRSFRSGTYVGLGIPALAHGIYMSEQINHSYATLLKALIHLPSRFPTRNTSSHPCMGGSTPSLWRLYTPCCVLHANCAEPDRMAKITNQLCFYFRSVLSLRLLLPSVTKVNFGLAEIDVRSVLDPRAFIEIPSFLFVTLCYAIWISFNRLGYFAPTTWPTGVADIRDSLRRGPSPNIRQAVAVLVRSEVYEVVGFWFWSCRSECGSVIVCRKYSSYHADWSRLQFTGMWARLFSFDVV